MIDPSIWQSEDFSKLSTLAKLVFIGLFSNADDEGRGRAKAIYIKSILFPYDEVIRVTDIEKSLDEIAANMSITFYSRDGSEFYSLENWSKWQKIDKAQVSQIPAFDEDSTMIRGAFVEQSSNGSRTVAEQSSSAREPVPPKRKEENKKRIEEKGKEEADDFADRSFSQALQTKIQEWLGYKHERKEDYRPTGKKAFLTMLENKVKMYGEDAVIESINTSMANGWKGLFWEKWEKKGGGQKQSTASYNIGEVEDYFLHNTPVYEGGKHGAD